MAAYLVSDRTSRAYPIGSGPLTIGRDSVSHVVVDDPTVSRFHAEVRADDRGRRPVYTFRSMGSAGSSVNGESVKAERKLAEGDTITIRGETWRFTQEALPAGVTVAQRSDAPADSASLKATQVVRSVEAATIEPLPTQGIVQRLAAWLASRFGRRRVTVL
ncbi:MAG TPA: FHA domain-containing protein [Gemmatimonadaceae bacterium]|nr:FHA domain-containing protein [Gemmatimonadaceae bacterium]